MRSKVPAVNQSRHAHRHDEVGRTPRGQPSREPFFKVFERHTRSHDLFNEGFQESRHRLFTFAAIVGATDIDPFVLNIAAGGIAPFSDKVGVAAILIAASTNNLAKAMYAAGFAAGRVAAGPAGSLALLALADGIVAWRVPLGG